MRTLKKQQRTIRQAATDNQTSSNGQSDNQQAANKPLLEYDGKRRQRQATAMAASDGNDGKRRQ